MATQKGMSDYTLTLDGVNAQSINAPGDFIHVQSVSVTGLAVQIAADDGKVITRFQGQGNRLVYTRLTVSASAPCTVTIQAGYGYATDSRASFDGTITAPITPAARNVPLADVSVPATTQELLEGATANRLELMVGVASTAANGVRIGDNTAAAGKGTLVEPGQIVTFASSDAVYAFNEGASAVAVNLTSLRSS